MSQYLIGIDIGTSACKVAIFNKVGEVIASDSHSYPIYYPQEGYVEQDPEEWWQGICIATKKVVEKAKINVKDIVGVGIDGQSWSAIPVDKEGNLLAKTPIWMDIRSQDICERLNNIIGEEEIFHIAGNSLQPSYTTAKIIWFKENMPEVFYKTDKFLQS